MRNELCAERNRDIFWIIKRIRVTAGFNFDYINTEVIGSSITQVMAR
ncbi:hypothetical protein PhaeoP97_03823 (plasmid) [Phaeobacter porticola]|uniref:Uncharacterized protein n=1 Tax=Phaeobacter porticola TaxID=1844006 RepID=A0A1L3IAW3_9RHOB|nr:hypothetical protein PhaeoP97_03823 [Phaeobacter porticola]